MILIIPLWKSGQPGPPHEKKQLIIFYVQPIRNVVEHFSREGVPVPAELPLPGNLNRLREKKLFLGVKPKQITQVFSAASGYT